MGSPTVEGAKVVAKVLSQDKAKKIMVFLNINQKKTTADAKDTDSHLQS